MKSATKLSTQYELHTFIDDVDFADTISALENIFPLLARLQDNLSKVSQCATVQITYVVCVHPEEQHYQASTNSSNNNACSTVDISCNVTCCSLFKCTD